MIQISAGSALFGSPAVLFWIRSFAPVGHPTFALIGELNYLTITMF